MDFAYRFAPRRAFNSLISAATRWRRPISCPHCIQPFIERLGSSLAHEELEEGVFGGSYGTGEAPGCRGGITSGAAVRWRIQRSAAHKADRASAARPSRRTPTPDTASRRRPAAEAHTPLRATWLRQDDTPQRLAGAGAATHRLAHPRRGRRRPDSLLDLCGRRARARLSWSHRPTPWGCYAPRSLPRCAAS